MTDVLHVMQASLQFSDPLNVIERDLDTIYGRGADLIGHTEAADLNPVLTAACAAHGYRIFQPRIAGKFASTAFAVKRGIKVTDAYFVDVIPGQSGPAALGGHSPRGMTVVELSVFGSNVSATEFHVITGWGKASAERQGQILTQWETTTKAAARLGRGRDLSILMGDVNYDEGDRSPNTPSNILESHGWQSAYAEAGQPDLPTHGSRTIDMIYTLKQDRRVVVKRVKRWPDQTGIDHQQVSVWIEIRRRQS